MRKYIIYLPYGNSLTIEAKRFEISQNGKFIWFYNSEDDNVATFVIENIVGIMIDTSL